jgi:hypothetical protein
MSRILIAQQLVWLRDVPYDNKTEFEVVEGAIDEKAKPVQVDIATAGAWLRSGWAKDKAKPAK